MSDSSWLVPDDIEVGKVGTCKKNIEWFEKGTALLEKIYGGASNNQTIFKCERKGDGREPLEPRAVAIGPYHRNCKNRPLKFDHDYKLEITRFMTKYCSLDRKKYLEEMDEKEKDVRRCYDQDLSEWDSKEFRTMLLLDSSFILFVMDGFSETDQLLPHDHYVEYMAFYLEVMQHWEQIKLDLLTVDNQIPFFTIEILLRCFPRESVNFTKSIEELALSCFDDLWPMKNEERERYGEDQFNHLLHLFHWSRIPASGYEKDGASRSTRIYKNAPQRFIPSAMELKKSAIKFKKKESGSNLEITFTRGLMNLSAVINIPTLDLYDCSEAIMHNLIAFEGDPASSVLCFSAYSACMSCLLQREDDVKLLRESRIIASTSFEDADVIKFFKNLNREVHDRLMPDTLLEFYESVVNHHYSPISQWYGNFPWIKIALAGSYLLYLLTLLQAVYSVLGYHEPKNK